MPRKLAPGTEPEPAKWKSDPGSGSHNCKVMDVIKRKMKKKLQRDPFLTAAEAQKERRLDWAKKHKG